MKQTVIKHHLEFKAYAIFKLYCFLSHLRVLQAGQKSQTGKIPKLFEYLCNNRNPDFIPT